MTTFPTNAVFCKTTSRDGETLRACLVDDGQGNDPTTYNLMISYQAAGDAQPGAFSQPSDQDGNVITLQGEPFDVTLIKSGQNAWCVTALEQGQMQATNFLSTDDGASLYRVAATGG